MFAALAAFAGLAGLWRAVPVHDTLRASKAIFKSAPSQDACSDVFRPGALPARIEVDPFLQAFATEIVRKHPTRLAAAFAMDLSTRAPLVAVFSENGNVRIDLSALAAPRYPMASLAKMTTAWAAMSEKGITPSHVFHLRGQAHTLYKGQIDTTRGDTISLARAFAYSANPIFGQIGVHYLGTTKYMSWLDTMGFNRPGGLGGGIPAGVAKLPKDTYNLAELSSGFVRTTFVSPIHACMLARRYAGGGELLPPRWSGAGDCPRPIVRPESQQTKQMLSMMRLTADSGTARRAFEQVWDDDLREDFEFGGKTGSLDGDNPRGHYEWFAGFARRKGHPDSGIAIAVLAVADGRQMLPGTWFAAQILGAWRRHFGQTRKPVLAEAVLPEGKTLFSDDDQEALAARPTFRPPKVRKKKGKASKNAPARRASKKHRRHA